MDALRLAHAYKRDGTILMHADARTSAGYWIAWPPMIVLEATALGAIGAGARQVLAESRSGIPAPDRAETIGQPMLAAAGVRSWRALTRVSLGLMLELTGSTLALKGTKHDAKRTAFVHNKSVVSIILDDLDQETLGRSIVDAFSMSA